jgi:methylated-DNA-[protein]-cysteine S-methyltransferase
MKFNTQTVRTHWVSPLGSLILAASDAGLCGVWFADQRHLPDAAQWPQTSHPLLQLAQSQLGEYFAEQRTQFDLPLDLSGGTAFQQQVWQALLHIPNGHTTSYGALSHSLNNPLAVRAVGAAVGRNPIGIIVPCHRVLGADGSLTGYAGGLARKTALLKLEGVITNDLFATSAQEAPAISRAVL